MEKDIEKDVFVIIFLAQSLQGWHHSTTNKTTSAKGKQPLKKPAAPPSKPSASRVLPPEPLPPIAARLSAYSPALPTGVLIETVKAGMNAEAGAAAAPGGAPQIPAGGKGKRKIIRARG